MRPYTSLNVYRICDTRLLRPPASSRARLISFISPLKSNNTRPQLPFLQNTLNNPNRGSIFRRISTKEKSRLLAQLRVLGWSLLVIWVGGSMVAIGHGLMQEQYYDILYPCPPEWKFAMKHNWRDAHHRMIPDKFGQGLADWALVGHDFRNLIAHALQDPDVNPNVDWDHTIPGVDAEKDFMLAKPVSSLCTLPRFGEDVSTKSESWKKGYFEAWMGYALAAEKYHDHVLDKSRRIVFPRRFMIGPSNPNPTPLPASHPDAAPLEENCGPCFEPPSFFYIHILTTKGFSSRQRIEAALAWSSWLVFQGDTPTAAKLNNWSMDLACQSLQAEGIDPKQIINRKTNGIKPTAPFVTPNILKACTQIATFEATTNGNLSSALNIYISVLRARRSAPEAPPDKQYNSSPPNIQVQSIENLMRFFRSLRTPPPQPPLLGSGNEPYIRTKADKCDEAAIMNYIGEILFATASQATGIAWTRDAVLQAETGHNDTKMDPYSRLSCAYCVEAGITNWLRMANVLVAEEQQRKIFDHNGHVVGIRRGWLDRLKAVFGGEGSLAKLIDSGDWRLERQHVEMRRAAFLERRMVDEMNDNYGPFL